MTKYTINQVIELLKEKNQQLLSTEYISSKHKLLIKCKCDFTYERTLNSILSGYYHCSGKNRAQQKPNISIQCQNQNCKKEFIGRTNRKYCSLTCTQKVNSSKEHMIQMSEKSRLKRGIHLLTTIICKQCQTEFKPSHSLTILCSLDCKRKYEQTDEYKEKAKEYGRRGGLVSVTKQDRRSKNEMAFANLCQKYFGKQNVICNQPIFDGWDADVILPELKIAVLWNGNWHYKQISKTQSLHQVLVRDTIKLKVIEKHGYIPYIIKDTGKYNISFVKQEFELFCLMKMDY